MDEEGLPESTMSDERATACSEVFILAVPRHNDRNLDLECHYPVDVDAFDQSSQVSELSLSDTLSMSDRQRMERALENLTIASFERRALRRQWNPNVHLVSCHPSSSLYHSTIPASLAISNQEPDADVTNLTRDTGENRSVHENLNLEIDNPLSQDHDNHCVNPFPEAKDISVDTRVYNSDCSTAAGHHAGAAAQDSKYHVYECAVDTTQGDKAVEILIHSFKRPHMRSFHMSWMAFFIAFFTWFSISPLLPEVRRSLDLTQQDVWTSSTFAFGGSAVTRILIGPFCDNYGARWTMAGTLILCAIPTALTGLVQSAMGLNILRLFVGIAGSAFVPCLYWTSSMFTTEVAGTANALVAGWGNLGGGVTQIVMGSIVFPLFKHLYEIVPLDENELASEMAWRTACVVPALFCLLMAFLVIRYSDDSPKGNFSKRHKDENMTFGMASSNVIAAFSNLNTWILLIQYGCCFGVEVTIINACALYFHDEFGQSTESAAAIASIFGWMNLFARGVGGFLSDYCNYKMGIRGRLWIQLAVLFFEGLLLIMFGQTHSLPSAISVMIILSIFVQAGAGSTFGIVPCIDPLITGSIVGIVGAGGNLGGVAFSLLFWHHNYSKAFMLMGGIVMVCALLSIGFLEDGRLAVFRNSESVGKRGSLDESSSVLPNVHPPPSQY